MSVVRRVGVAAIGLGVGIGAGISLGAGIGLAQAGNGETGSAAPASSRNSGVPPAVQRPRVGAVRPARAAARSRGGAAGLASRALASESLTDKQVTQSATVASATSAAPPTLDQIIRYTLFNKAPIANPVQLAVNSQTRVVSGELHATDPDGGAVTYSVTKLPVSGTVEVSPTGAYAFTPNSELAESGGTDQFRVTIADANVYRLAGVLGAIQAMLHSLAQGMGLSGPDSTTVTVNVSIGSTSGPPDDGVLSTFCGCVLMPKDTIFHADVSALPVLTQSDTWLDVLGANRGATLRAAWGGEPWMGSTGGMPVNVVGASHPLETVIFNRGYSTSGPGIDDSPYAIPDHPLVEGMPDVPAWDRHLLVFQEGTCISQELYNVANGVELPANSILDGLGNAAYAALYGSAWIAEAGVHVDMNSPLYPIIGHANASRLPYLPMILRPDELESGHIDHMLGIVIAKDNGIGYTWPARSGDGDGSNPNGVPMGTVFRLRADFDMSGYAPSTQVVLRALQEHGAVVYDSMGPGIDGAGLLAMSNGWTGTDYVTTRRELDDLPMSAFEAVDVSGIAVDPMVGWQIFDVTV